MYLQAYHEVTRLEKQESDLMSQKIQLTKEKEGLIINFGTLIEPLPYERKVVAQKMLLQILRHKGGPNQPKSINDYVKQETLDPSDFLPPQAMTKPPPPPPPYSHPHIISSYSECPSQHVKNIQSPGSSCKMSGGSMATLVSNSGGPSGSTAAMSITEFKNSAAALNNQNNASLMSILKSE